MDELDQIPSLTKSRPTLPGFVQFWSSETTISHGAGGPYQPTLGVFARGSALRIRRVALRIQVRTSHLISASHTLMLTFAICTKIVRC